MRRSEIGALAAAATVALAWPAAASSSCVLLTQEEQRRSADLIFVGTALENPTATGVQRFKVERYEKGTGPDVARVETGVAASPDGTASLTSVSIEANNGERWRIYGLKRQGGLVETNECLGSAGLASAPASSAGAPGSPDGASGGGLRWWMLLAGVAVVTAAASARRALRSRRRSARQRSFGEASSSG